MTWAFIRNAPLARKAITMAKPFEVYAVNEREGQDKAWWTRIGSAFKNKDGSLSVLFDALPTNARCVIRAPREDRDEDDGEDRKPRKAAKDRKPREDKDSDPDNVPF